MKYEIQNTDTVAARRRSGEIVMHYYVIHKIQIPKYKVQNKRYKIQNTDTVAARSRSGEIVMHW